MDLLVLNSKFVWYGKIVDSAQDCEEYFVEKADYILEQIGSSMSLYVDAKEIILLLFGHAMKVYMDHDNLSTILVGYVLKKLKFQDRFY